MSEKKILLIGATGSGKSSFINVMTNYLKKGSLRNLHIAIPTKYLQSTMGYKDTESDVKDRSRSQTNFCTPYPFVFAGTKYVFIDSPGLNDSRGMAQDEKNIDNILDAAANSGTLAAIILVMNGSECRVTPAIQNVLTRLKGNVPDVVLKNITVVLTNCRKSTSSFEIKNLRTHIPALVKENVFYMNNSAFACRAKDGKIIHIDPVLEAEWKESMATCKAIIDFIGSRGGVNTDGFKQMQKARFALKAILNKSKIEMVNLQNVLEQLQAAEEMSKMSENDVNAFKNFTQDEEIEMVEQQPCNYHNTLCSEHNNVCHNGCGLNEISTKGDNAFRNCAAMNGSDTCRVCPGSCSYTNHFHGKFLFVKTKQTVQKVLEDMKKKYEEASDKKNKTELDIKSLSSTRSSIDTVLRKTIDELRKECEAMKKICSGFNFTDELHLTLHQLELEAKSLRSFDAKKAAQDTINMFKRICNEFSKLEQRTDMHKNHDGFSSSDDDDDNYTRTTLKTEKKKKKSTKKNAAKSHSKRSGYGDSDDDDYSSDESEDDDDDEDYRRGTGAKGKKRLDRHDEPPRARELDRRRGDDRYHDDRYHNDRRREQVPYKGADDRYYDDRHRGDDRYYDDRYHDDRRRGDDRYYDDRRRADDRYYDDRRYPEHCPSGRYRDDDRYYDDRRRPDDRPPARYRDDAGYAVTPAPQTVAVSSRNGGVDNRVLFITGVPPEVSWKQLELTFAQFGVVERVDKQPTASWITYKHPEDAEKALRTLHMTALEHHPTYPLSIRYHTEKPHRSIGYKPHPTSGGNTHTTTGHGGASDSAAKHHKPRKQTTGASTTHTKKPANLDELD